MQTSLQGTGAPAAYRDNLGKKLHLEKEASHGEKKLQLEKRSFTWRKEASPEEKKLHLEKRSFTWRKEGSPGERRFTWIKKALPEK